MKADVVRDRASRTCPKGDVVLVPIGTLAFLAM
jgi:hypothetical protein